MDEDQAKADPHLLTMTAYPPGPGPYERWAVTTPTGDVLVDGTTFPPDQDAVRQACAAYHKRIDKASEPDPDEDDERDDYGWGFVAGIDNKGRWGGESRRMAPWLQ